MRLSEALLASNLLLNRYFEAVETWDEAAIKGRGLKLAEQLTLLWPNPRQPKHETELDADRIAARPNFDVEQLRALSLARLASLLGVELLQKGDARYVSPDGRQHVLCLASQPYPDRHGEGYWFGVSPMQLEFLSIADAAHVALCCGSPDRILWFPRTDFCGLVDNMNRTPEKHWHVQVVAGTTIALDQPKKQMKADVTRYLLPVP
jgi:hypothetical protein